MNKMKNISMINFLFEAVTLKRLQRTGWQILGGNEESVAEHSYMVTVISFLLADQMGADVKKTLIMALFHDLTEARIGDVHKLADLYVKTDERRAEKDAFSSVGKIGKELMDICGEYRGKKTIESKIVHDADVLALCIELKSLFERGDHHAKEWFDANGKRLVLKESNNILQELKEADSQDWWKKERNKLHKSD